MATETNKYGLYFPLILEGGAPVNPSIADSIDSSLRIILSWEYSRRYFLYPFGSPLNLLVSSPHSDSMLVTIQRYVIRAIERWETRLTINSVEVIRTTDESLEINISGTINESQDTYNYNIQI